MGDGAHDFNPIADLTATEVVEFLKYLGAPKSVIEKPRRQPFRRADRRGRMGITYKELDAYLTGGQIPDEKRELVERMHRASEHKRRGIVFYKEV